MSSLEDKLKSRQLRAAEPAAAAASVSSLADDVARERAQNERLRAVDLESWYDRLTMFTFATHFVAFSPDEARALMAAYRARLAADQAAGDGSTDASRAVPSETGAAPAIAQALCHSRATDLSDSDCAHLDALEGRLAAGLAALGPHADDGVFAKLSSRSPKDSRVCEARALAAIKVDLTQRLAAGEHVDSNTVAVAVMGAAIAALRVRGARGVLEALVTSERVCEDDLPLALGFPACWSQHVVLREWVAIPSWCELRGFVYGGRLTGLSQYFKGVCFPQLVAVRERVAAAVQRAFAAFAPHVGLEPAEYVLDLAVDPTTDRVWIIELNPFGKPDGLGTGTSLFSLACEHDAAVLFGDAPFEFRVQEAPIDVPLAAQIRSGPLRDWLAARVSLDKHV